MSAFFKLSDGSGKVDLTTWGACDATGPELIGAIETAFRMMANDLSEAIQEEIADAGVFAWIDHEEPGRLVINLPLDGGRDDVFMEASLSDILGSEDDLADEDHPENLLATARELRRLAVRLERAAAKGSKAPPPASDGPAAE